MGSQCSSKPKVSLISQYRIETLASPQQTLMYNKAKQNETNGDFDTAIQLYNKAITINPNSDLSYNGIGNCLLKKGLQHDAISCYEKAIEINPNCKYAYNGLGATYESLQDNSRAIANYNKAIAVDSNFSYPYNGLGNLYYFHQNYVEALPYYEGALRLSPNNALMYANLACCQIMMGKIDQSFESFTTANKLAKIKDNDNQLSPANKQYLQMKLAQFKRVVKTTDPKHRQQYFNIINEDLKRYETSNLNKDKDDSS